MKTGTLKAKARAANVSRRVKIDNVVPKPLQIHNVLVPVDFSPASHEALEVALTLVKPFGAEVHLAHVVPIEYRLAGLADVPILVPQLEVAPRVRKDLRNLATEYGHGLRAHTHALHGRPFEEICRLASKIDIDLIAIATHGYTGLKHFALGSTTERVVRYSPCPVLVVRATRYSANGVQRKPRLRGAKTIRKILVPVDFSACSNKGIDYAKELAKKFKASLLFVHSIYFQYHVTSDEYARYDYPLCVQEADKAAQKQMRELVRATEADGIMVEPLLATGHAGEQICSRARTHGADLIVTSTHGWTGFKHVLIGSTAEYVVRHAHCPVLVVPTHLRPDAPRKES